MAYDPERSTRVMLEYMSKIKQQDKEAKQEEERRRLAELGQEPSKEKSWQEHMYVDADKPDTMDNGTATLWYIIIMIIGAVFNDRLLIWIFATVIWWRHINRKAIRQKEWNKKHNGGNRS
jgi:hypothetical protein